MDFLACCRALRFTASQCLAEMRGERSSSVNRRLALLALAALSLAALAACGGTSSSRTANTVTVTLSDFKIEASRSTFTTGTTYHFVVTNSGQTNHEFMIAPSANDAMSMHQMDNMALYHIDVSALPPGATKEFDFTFPSAAPIGKLEFACHVGSHYQLGMKAAIVVNPR